MVSDGQAGMNIDETRSIDDEYSPGVFKVSVLSVCQHLTCIYGIQQLHRFKKQGL